VKIVLSRKGFDSGSGGIPSPILPDGTLVSLPIPDKKSTIRYDNIQFDRFGCESMLDLVNVLGGQSFEPDYRAHLDPDLVKGSLPRAKGWLPLFGQTGGALHHLTSNGVDIGSLFLFFGWFRQTTISSGKLIYDREAPNIHILFGFLSVGKYVDVPSDSKYEEWMRYHPHFRISNTPSRIFVAAEGFKSGRKIYTGAGAFSTYSSSLRLSKFDSQRSIWKVPPWFYPTNMDCPALTYHFDKARWNRFADHVELRSVTRGQEFVFDTETYPQAEDWIQEILDSSEII
jgi:hypothetical protein